MIQILGFLGLLGLFEVLNQFFDTLVSFHLVNFSRLLGNYGFRLNLNLFLFDSVRRKNLLRLFLGLLLGLSSHLHPLVDLVLDFHFSFE